MIKIVLLLVYLMNNEITVEQKAFDDEGSCQTAGGKRVAELANHPGVQGIYLAGCVEAHVNQA